MLKKKPLDIPTIARKGPPVEFLNDDLVFHLNIFYSCLQMVTIKYALIQFLMLKTRMSIIVVIDDDEVMCVDWSS